MTSSGPSETLYGIHPILEALEKRSRLVERILVARERGGSRLGRLLKMAREAGVPVSYLPREVLARKAGTGRTHQGVVALVSAMPYADPEELCLKAAAWPDGLLLAVDGIQDPRNLGAVVRTAAAAGVLGILLRSEGNVGLTPTVAKTSAGALERLPVAREHRLPSRLTWLREKGFRALALDPRGATPWDQADLSGCLVIVAGGEATGVRPAVREACNGSISVPLCPGVDSLNVAVSVGVVLFEALRQRRGAGRGEGSGKNSVPRP